MTRRGNDILCPHIMRQFFFFLKNPSYTECNLMYLPYLTAPEILHSLRTFLSQTKKLYHVHMNFVHALEQHIRAGLCGWLHPDGLHTGQIYHAFPERRIFTKSSRNISFSALLTVCICLPLYSAGILASCYCACT